MSTSSLVLHAAPAAGFDQPFEMLGACHERVRRSLALLERLAEYLLTHEPDEPARRAAADVLRYFDVAAPAHHEDEERHVLPVLRASGDPALAALAARLHDDHERMAAAWARARTGLAALAAGAAAGTGAGSGAGSAAGSAAGSGAEAWRAFAALYEDHLAAEDGVAFPEAAARVPVPAVRAMGQEMAARRGAAPPA